MAQNFNNPSLLSEKPKQAAQIDNLFKLDVKTDNLQHFLENLVQAVNKQSLVINKIQEDLRQKVDKRQVENAFTKIHSGIKLHDTEFTKNVNYLMGKPLPENTGDMIENAANKCANQTTLLGHACHYLYKGNKDWDTKLLIIEKALDKKCDTDQMKQKVKKNKKKLLHEIDELKRKLQKQMDDLQRKCTNQISKFEVSLKETEKKTLWKIQDAEALLQKRVTSDFVDNSLKQLEDKIMREIAKQKDENFGGIMRNLEDLSEQLRRVDDSHCDKNKSLKKQLKDMEDMLLNKLCGLEAFNSYKKLMNEKIQELDNRITQVDSRGDAKQLFQQLKDILRELEQNLITLDRDEKQLEIKVNELDIKVQMGGGGKQEDLSGIDPHKVCLLETDLKRLRDEVNNQANDFKALENQLKRQFQTLEHKVLSNFALLKQQDGQNFSKEEIIAMHERLKIKFEEKSKLMQRDLDELKSKMRLLNELDKRMKKKFADIENNSEFMKLLVQKADDGEVKREFVHQDEKVRNLTELVGQMRREFESIDQFFNQLQMLLKTNQQETISIITGNQKIIPNRCLACGIKGKQTYNSNEMRGYDGKIYKADLGTSKQASVYDQQEVFDIMPSQIQYSNEQQQQHQQMNNSNKFGYGQPIQRPERPTSAKSDFTNQQQQQQDHLPTINESNNNKNISQQNNRTTVQLRPTSAKRI